MSSNQDCELLTQIHFVVAPIPHLHPSVDIVDPKLLTKTKLELNKNQAMMSKTETKYNDNFVNK